MTLGTVIAMSCYTLFNNYMVSYVPTNSMEGYIEPGSLILSEKNADSYQIGDVAIYDTGEIMIVHRIIDITDKGYQFKGDNNPLPDKEYVQEEQLVAKFMYASKTGGIIHKNMIFILIGSMVFSGVNSIRKKIWNKKGSEVNEVN